MEILMGALWVALIILGVIAVDSYLGISKVLA